MRVLHVVKTSDGAGWAAAQAAELVKRGVEVHVAVPRRHGQAMDKWVRGGAIVHVTSTDLPVGRPWTLPAILRSLRELVSRVQPDLIHSHFVSSTVLLRLALGKSHRIPRIFQVPGPLHLEHRFWRTIELLTAGPADSWIASSRCIRNHYRAEGISPDRLYLSYYGFEVNAVPSSGSGLLRRRFGIAGDMKIVGNANLIYPPKWYLGHRIGLKAHEDVIDALGMVIRQRPDVTGVLIGGTARGSGRYESGLRERARRAGGNRILMTGYLPVEDVRQMWGEFDVAVHVPLSENCGGVCESLLAGVPTIAGRVGGLPEVVMDGLTGKLVSIRDPEELARTILEVIDRREHFQRLARVGGRLVAALGDLQRTADEVADIYGHVLDADLPRPPEFDSLTYVRQCGEAVPVLDSSVPRM